MDKSNERCESILFDLEAIAKALENDDYHALVRGVDSTEYAHNALETDYNGLAKACLSTALAWASGIEASKIFLSKGPRGKPEFSAANHRAPLYFNYSRSRRVCVVSLCALCPVGVDIELAPVARSTDWLRKKQVSRANVVQRFYVPEEQELLSRLDIESEAHLHLWHREFLRMWTAKESMVKAWGQSIGSHALFVDTTRSSMDYAGEPWETATVATELVSAGLPPGFVSVSTPIKHQLRMESHFRVFAGDLATFGRKTL